MWQEVPPLLFGDADDSFQGVIPPEYIPNRITIPTLEEIHALKEVGSKALVVIIDLMSGCGHRNGEAFAANLEGMVADDVYRITEQIEGKTRQRSPLKHRRAGAARVRARRSWSRQRAAGLWARVRAWLRMWVAVVWSPCQAAWWARLWTLFVADRRPAWCRWGPAEIHAKGAMS
ncbi:hypothetical protein OG933_01700 [Streptomyces sp. NBC_00016]|uniref:hypothetical protein n=1 Tax=Streptomyces sp. NBC_00016 TaxID=2975622 RepID=UPI003249AF27